jgi:hypothetical protein
MTENITLRDETDEIDEIDETDETDETEKERARLCLCAYVRVCEKV